MTSLTNHQFTETTAFIDQFKIEIGTWRITASHTDIALFVTYLGDIHAHIDTEYPAAFNIKRPEIIQGVYRISTRDTLGEQSQRPIFQGQLRVKPIGTEDDEFTGSTYQEVEISLALNLNMNRFIAAQSWPHQGALPNHCNIFSDSNPPLDSRRNGEYTLDRNDNVMLNLADRRLVYGNRLIRGIELYIQTIEAFISTEVDTYFDSIEYSHWRHSPYYNVQFLEVFWEVSNEHPRESVRDLASTLFMLANQCGRTEYHNITEEREHSSPVIWRQLSTYRKLKIYAKTNARVRVEVSSNIKKDSGNFSITRHTANSLEQLLEMIMVYREELTASVNESFLGYSEIEETNTHTREQLAELIHRLFEKSNNDVAMANDLVSELICFGSTGRQGKTDEQMLYLRRLEHAGILVYQRRPHARYVLAEAYRGLVERIDTISQEQ